MDIPILRPERHWVCPNCTETAVTHVAAPHTRFHECRGLKGMTAPLVPDGMDCKVVAVEREDYIGRDIPQTDGDGRPISAVRTVRADGTNDVAVMAPTVVVGALR